MWAGRKQRSNTAGGTGCVADTRAAYKEEFSRWYSKVAPTVIIPQLARQWSGRALAAVHHRVI